MPPEPVILDSVRRHGISDEDMLHARRNSIDVFAQDDDMTIHVGAGYDGALLEVGEIIAADGTELIAHAMRARPKYLR